MHLKSLRPAMFGLAALLATPLVALAQPGPGGPGGPGPMPMPLMMLIRQANLTSDQQAQVHQIMQTNFTQAQPLMKQLRDIHDQIADKLMSTGSVSASDIAPLQQQENQIHQQLDQQMLSTTLQIRALLTPDQLAKVAGLHNQLKSLRSQIDALVGDPGPMGPPPGVM